MNYEILLKLNTKQARLLEKILDLYVRIGIGQFEEIAQTINSLFDINSNNFELQGNLALELMKVLKRQLLGYDNGNIGISNEKVKNDVKVAYDLAKVLQKGIAVTEDHKSYSVWHDGAILHLGSEPIASISSKKEGEENWKEISVRGYPELIEETERKQNDNSSS